MTINTFMRKIEISEERCHTLAPTKAYLSRDFSTRTRLVTKRKDFSLPLYPHVRVSLHSNIYLLNKDTFFPTRFHTQSQS